MAPPAKRRRRNVLPSSSDGEEESQPTMPTAPMDPISSSPPPSDDTKPSNTQARASLKPQTRAKTANHPHNAAPIYLPSQVRAASKSASNSPEKPKKKGKVDEKVKSGDIFALFSKQARRQKEELETFGSHPKPKLSKDGLTPPKEADCDTISDTEDLGGSRAPPSSLVGLAARKRARGTEVFSSTQDGPSGSQKFFKKPSVPKASRAGEDLKPWAERFSPVNLDELAVHKKKVADVRGWLEGVMEGRMRQRLLLLKGASGTGKTTTIQLLSKDMGLNILEWRNPVGSAASADGYLSMSAQFEEFMGRGGKFGQLDIFSEGTSLAPIPESKPLDRRKNVILVEEFPNTFTRSSTALQSFRSAVMQYLVANTPPLSMMGHKNDIFPITPIIMIVSETLLTTSSASADSFTAHRLLGPEILQHPGVGIFEFNAIAPTILAKALELIVQKESRKSGRKMTPGPLVLKKVGEVGDIRSAIGSLEFLCLRGDKDVDHKDGGWGSKVAFGKTKRTSKDTALTEMEAQSLELVTRREASLGIFHAVGKVVYNKRDESSALLAVEQLPNHMTIHSRPRKSEVCVEDLIDETGTDTSTFLAALHENYLLSCDASPSSFDYSSLDHVNGCIDALSDSDLLCPSWDGTLNTTGFSTGGGSSGDILRQDEISFQIAVRGILFSLPYPVKRKAPAASGLRTGKGGDAFKMFYPTSLKLWRMREEIEGMLDLWVARLMRGEDHAVTPGAAAFLRARLGTVESWKSSRPGVKISKEAANSAPLLSIGTSARKEMLLERLPYMVSIARAQARKRGQATSTFAIQDMEKITTFSGIGAPVEEAPEEENETEPKGENWATDRPGEGRTPKKKGLAFRGRATGSGVPLPVEREQKLVLSDDDIEDD